MILGHFSADDIPVVLLNLFALSTSLDETEVIHMCLGCGAKFDAVGGSVLGRLMDFKHTKNQGNRRSASTTLEAKDIDIDNTLDGVKIRAFNWYGEGRDASEDSNSKGEKREGTHYNYKRVLSVR